MLGTVCVPSALAVAWLCQGRLCTHMLSHTDQRVQRAPAATTAACWAPCGRERPAPLPVGARPTRGELFSVMRARLC